MIETRLIAATYLGRSFGYRWLVRTPNFACNYDLRLRLYAEHCLSMGLSEHAETLNRTYVAPDVRDARIANFYCAEHYLSQLPDGAPLDA